MRCVTSMNSEIKGCLRCYIQFWMRSLLIQFRNRCDHTKRCLIMLCLSIVWKTISKFLQSFKVKAVSRSLINQRLRVCNKSVKPWTQAREQKLEEIRYWAPEDQLRNKIRAIFKWISLKNTIKASKAKYLWIKIPRKKARTKLMLSLPQCDKTTTTLHLNLRTIMEKSMITQTNDKIFKILWLTITNRW